MQRQNRNNKLNRLNISKTQYCWLWQCPKRAWLQKYKPELAEEDAGAKSRMAAGRMVGEIAKGLFDSYVDVTVCKGDFLDIPAMKAATMQEISRNTPVICEACFSHYRLFCAVDILRKTPDGWAIYEVSPSSFPDGSRSHGTYQRDCPGAWSDCSNDYEGMEAKQP